MTEANDMDDCLIDINDKQEERRNKQEERKNTVLLKDATLWELVCQVCRRLWFCMRGCGRRILQIFGFKSFRDRDDRIEGDSLLPISTEEEEIQRLRNEISHYKRSIQDQLSQINNLHDENKEASYRHIQEVQSLENEIENMKRRLRNTMNEKEEMKRSKDDALSRLSELMGDKLRHNNPAITDLNDPNRPMKLGEQFSETYENDWTEAFINLQEDEGNQQITEEETVEILLNILREVNNRSIAESSLQLSGILQSIQSLPNEETTDFMRKVKDAHKANAVQFAPLIYKKITSENSDCKTVSKYINHCQPYVENCVKICYFAAVQDPPLYLDFEPGETFDKQIFKEYTTTGTKVRFLVWPALFLHRGGALLSKGVVQPLSE